jgi:hypothetical protein
MRPAGDELEDGDVGLSPPDPPQPPTDAATNAKQITETREPTVCQMATTTEHMATSREPP